MKKIINGLRYDTDTATLIGEASHGYVSDFAHWSAGLYVTANRRFFLAGKGGAMSRFACSCSDNSRTGGSGLFPLNEDEAREWAEAHLDTEAVEHHFPIQDA